MPTKRQHFVPRVYMKAWEAKVETTKEPDKKFDGIYLFQNSNIGEGANIKSVLWRPHLYTIGFKYSFICKSCPKVKHEFVDMIFEYLSTGVKQPIYGKLGYNIIKTKKSIDKHFFEISNWDFYYNDGNLAKKSAITNQIDAMNSYILEMSFDDFFEKNWEKTCSDFIDSVHNGKPVSLGESERIIPENIANDMLSAFFVMLCRNPSFDAMGIYKIIKKNILYPIFISMIKRKNKDARETETIEAKEYADELMTGIWYSELYKMFFKKSGGFYHNVVEMALNGCQMILFESYDNTGSFITSDNPAFEHISAVERNNTNGFVFPLSPKYLVFIARGKDGINVVDHRFANEETVRHFNRIIAQHKTDSLISIQKDTSSLL